MILEKAIDPHRLHANDSDVRVLLAILSFVWSVPSRPPTEFNTMDFSVDPVQSVPREFLAVILSGFGNE